MRSQRIVAEKIFDCPTCTCHTRCYMDQVSSNDSNLDILELGAPEPRAKSAVRQEDNIAPHAICIAF